MGRSERYYENLAQILKAMGHPTRWGILKKIMGSTFCVSDLERDLGRSQPNISQHLGILRDRGLVVPERKGNMTCYRLADERIADLIRLAEQVFGKEPARRAAV